MQHRTGREEGHDLYHRVDDQVQEGRCQGLGGHQGGGKQNIRQVRHRGVSQPQLEVPLLQGHAGAVYNGDDGQQQRQLLGPGTGQNVRAEAVIDQADAGEGTGLYHRHRVEQGRDGGGGHRRRGKPTVQRPNGGLDPEAHKGQGEHCQQHGQISVIARQVAAQGEVRSIVDGQEHQPDKRQGRAGDGVYQVLDAGLFGGLGHGLHHQGQGGQSQQLIEQVHGHHVGGEGNAQGDAEGCREKCPEHVQVLFVAHVVKAIEHGKGPQGGRQPRKQTGSPVHAEGDGQPVGKVQQGERAVIAQEDGRPGQGRGAQDQEAVYQAAAALAADGQEIGQQAQHQRQEHRQKEKNSIHMVHLLTEWTR